MAKVVASLGKWALREDVRFASRPGNGGSLVLGFAQGTCVIAVQFEARGAEVVRVLMHRNPDKIAQLSRSA